ncbi:UTP--glucose-1-phosphate uridylyltransferase 3, chloroplastic [Ananas comosus]|uniref:UTP--glucose-1-phosphate uridylyltransferase 3, chloroplastic n=1 Tax=Ananas comosus TaxID=4615 RepID=A0A6P5HGC5_ANACO|nr:UTP--glucose-1-phosphate uridylyltransferase 3, chloroplastic [Ananas comosus]
MASSSSLRPPLISSRSLSSPSLPSFFFHPSRSRSLLFPKPLLCLSFPSSPSPSPSSSSSSSLRTHRVSTAPVEQAPAPEFGFGDEIARLGALRSQLRGARSLDEKLRVLDADSRVGDFFGNGNGGVLGELEALEVYLLKCLVAAGQGHVLGSELDWGGGGGGGDRVEGSALRSALYTLADLVEKWSLHGHASGIVDDGVGGLGVGEMELLRKLLKILGEIEQFYDCIGGIIGYQIMVLELLSPLKAQTLQSRTSEFVELHVPSGLNLMEDAEYASQAALWGIEGLPELGEIYPLGGAGDRLGLVDPVTGECLPAALLPYCGRTLLEGLIRDLQAREFLYFKIYGRQTITPVAIMTSSVKNNHEHVTALCERLNWFGRGRQNFEFFEQPLVPVVAAKDGKWLISRSLFPVCKPGGHGAVWKLAYDKGIFQWFYRYGRKGATVRQVSNVVAATDLTLLALAGLGLRHNKKLGFASCERNVGATEGINVLVEKQNLEGQWAYGITCIEYTEFEKYGIIDTAVSLGSLQADFPANTNILYVDLRAAEKVGSSQNTKCLPGMVLNLKKRVSYVDHLGFECSAAGGRLECTMQNIADNFLNAVNSRCNKGIESELDTFIVYNKRRRVTSSAKRKWKPEDRSLHQTPEGSLLDVMRNAYDLLMSCNIELPKIKDNSSYFHSGPPFLIFLHPALGPLWEITRQKFFGGFISEGSELQVEVAEFLWRDVKLDGSLIILAEHIMGSTMVNDNGESVLLYGTRCGRCKLQSVKVTNKGIDWSSPNNVYWKHDVKRFETLKIILHGNAEFEAKDVVLQGNHQFEVPDGYRMCVSQDSAGFSVKVDPIADELMESGSWFWKYNMNGMHINLEMVKL